MSEYPILVADYANEQQACAVVCEICGAEAVVGPDDLLNDGIYACPRNWGAPVVRWDDRHRLPCPDGRAVHKFQVADECPNCDALGYWDDALDGCCSRACVLQVEYARGLGA